MIGIVPRIFPAVNFNDVCVLVFATLNLGHNVSSRNIFSIADIVMLVPAPGAIILTFDLSHVAFPNVTIWGSQKENFKAPVER